MNLIKSLCRAGLGKMTMLEAKKLGILNTSFKTFEYNGEMYVISQPTVGVYIIDKLEGL